MAWGGPVEPSVRRESWKKEIRRGPRPGDGGPYESTTAVRDRAIAMTFGTQVAFGIGFGVLIVGATVFYAQYSGALRWVLGVVLLAGTGYIVVRFVGARARDPRPLEPEGRVERRATGDLRSLATTVDRASAGLKFSQVVVAGRMKDSFLEKVRVARGLGPEEIARLRSDPEGLMTLIGDRELVVFLLESERNHRHWPDLVRYLPARRGVGGGAGRKAARMEAPGLASPRPRTGVA